MHCKKCGTDLKQDVKFCPGCGTAVVNSSVGSSTSKSNLPLIIVMIAGILAGVAGLGIACVMLVSSLDKKPDKTVKTVSVVNTNLEEVSASTAELESVGAESEPAPENLATARINISNIETSAYPTANIKFTLFNMEGEPVTELGKQFLSVKVNNQYAEVAELTQLNGNEFSVKVNSPIKGPGAYDFEVRIATADYEGSAFSNVTVSAPAAAVAAAPPPAPARTAANNYYILPQSSSAYLSANQLSSLPLDTLQLARNEIYARHGHVFTNSKYSQYFNNQAWYVADPSYKSGDAALNQYEKSNVKLIQDYEELRENGSVVPNAKNMGNNYYIFPHSASAYVTDGDLAGMSLSQLQLARNEIYARHGYIFSKAEFSNYFNDQAWYSPNANYKVGDSTLNQYEKANIKLIQEYEDRY